MKCMELMFAVDFLIVIESFIIIIVIVKHVRPVAG